MKRIALYATLTLLLAGLLFWPARPQSVTGALSRGLLQARAWTFSALQTFGAGVTVSAGPFIRDELNVKEVCPAGCEFSTVDAAHDDISGNSAENRFTIYVHPGTYDGLVYIEKDYVSLVGADRMTTRLRGYDVWSTIEIAADVGPVLIANMTVGGRIPIRVAGNTSLKTLTVENVNIGIIDGTENDEKSIDCIAAFDADFVKIRSFNNQCETIWDAFIIGEDGDYLGIGNTFNIESPSSNLGGLWTAETGTSIREYNFHARITGNALLTNVRGLYFPNDGTSANDNVIELKSGVIEMVLTDAKFQEAACFDLATTAGTGDVRINIEDVDCLIDATAATNRPIRGIAIANDAQHATWDVSIKGGSILLEGGATAFDVDQAETVGGFSFTMDSVIHDGNYTGAGTVGVADTQSGRFGTSIIGPNAAITEGACLAGSWVIDTTATMELCVCETGGAGYRCVSLADGGPTD